LIKSSQAITRVSPEGQYPKCLQIEGIWEQGAEENIWA
jgi:hypothetical protein